jgi:hypothetical protein
LTTVQSKGRERKQWKGFSHQAMSYSSHLSFTSVAQMSKSSPALSDYKIKVLLVFYDQIILNGIPTSLIKTSSLKVHPSHVIYGSSQRTVLPVHTKQLISSRLHARSLLFLWHTTLLPAKLLTSAAITFYYMNTPPFT